MSNIEELKKKLGGGGGIMGGFKGGSGGYQAALQKKREQAAQEGTDSKETTSDSQLKKPSKPPSRRKRSTRDVPVGDEKEPYDTFSQSIVRYAVDSQVSEEATDVDEPAETVAQNEVKSEQVNVEINVNANISSNEIKDPRTVLEQELKEKQKIEELEKEGIYKTPLQATKEHLEKSQAKDTVKNELNTRPPPEALEEAGILKSQQQATKEQLQKSIAKDSLKQEMEDRADPEELQEAGILKTPIQATKEQLEKSQVKDQLKYDIEDRTDPEQLSEAGILKTQMQVTKEQLQKSQVKDTLKQEMEDRADPQELNEAGILKTPMQATKEQLEKSQVKDQLKYDIEDRTNPDQLSEAGILKTQMQLTKEQLQKSQVKDTLNQEIGDRVDPQGLNEAGILKTPIQATKEQLEKSQVKDQLKYDIEDRTDPDQLSEAGILKTQMQLTKEQLQKAQVKDTLKQEISDRVDPQELNESGILKTPMQATKEQLEKSQVKDQLKYDIEDRTDPQQLSEAGILKTQMQLTKEQLQKSQVKDTLNQEMGDRVDPQDLNEAGILKTPLQATKEQLEKSQVKDQLKYDIEDRVPPDQLSESIYKTPMQVTKEQLQKSQVKDTLKQEMEERTDSEELSEAGILKTPMQVIKEQLQKSQVKDQLKYDIEDRVAPDELSESIYKTPMQVTKEQLQKSQIKDNLKQEMTERVDPQELSEAGILKTPIQVAKEQLQKSQVIDQLKHDIEDRTAPDELGENIYKTPMQVTKEQLQKSQIKDTVKNELDVRVDPVELEDAGILKSPRQVTMEQLQKSQVKDTMKYELVTRPPAAALEEAGILKSPRQIAKEQLQKSLVKDTLKLEIEERPDPEQAAEMGFFKTPIQVSKEQLEKSQIRDTMKHELAARPSPNELESAGILKSPRQLNAEQLQKSLVKDMLKQEIAERPANESIEKDGIYKTQMQMAKEQLEKSQARDNVKQELESRPSIAQLEEAGILKTQMQLTKEQLQKSQVKDQLKHDIKERADPEELMQDNIYKTQMQLTKEQLQKSQVKDNVKNSLDGRRSVTQLQDARILKSPLQVSQEQLEKSLIKDQLKQGIQNRTGPDGSILESVPENDSTIPTGNNVTYTDDSQVSVLDHDQSDARLALEQGLKTRQGIVELEKGGIYKTPIQAAQEQLQKSQAKDQLRQEIEKRSDTQELVMKGVMTDGTKMAPSIQLSAKGLELNVKKDMVRQSLDAQPDIEDLEKQGIVYSATLAPAIQGAAQEVEQQFRYRGSVQDELVPPSIPEDEELRKARKRKARQSLQIHLKQRPSLTEVQQRGFAHPDYWKYETAEEAHKQRQLEVEKTEKRLSAFLAQRTSQEDIVYRGIVTDPDYFHKDKKDVEESKKRELSNKKSNLNEHLELKRKIKEDQENEASATVPMNDQQDLLFQLKAIASRHRRFSSAVGELKGQLPFVDATAQSVAEVVMDHVVTTYPDFKLCRGDNCTDPTHNHSKKSDVNDGRRGSIEMQNDNGANRRESVAIEETLRRRQSIHELGQKGYIKNSHVARRLQPAATDLEDRIESRMSKQQMERLGLVRRPSLADSLQPQAETLEAFIQKRRDTSPADNHPVSPGTGFKNEVAPSITAAAKAVNRRRMSFKLNQALTGRRDYQDLVDDGIVFSERMAPTLHARAQELEERLKERVTEHYLKRKGVLPAKLDLDYALQNVAGNLQKQLERRPSLANNEEFLRNILQNVNIDAIRPAKIVEEEEEAGQDDEEQVEIYQKRRENITNNLSRRLSVRATPQELQNRNIIPSEGDYFDDASSAMELKDIRRRLAKEGLKKRMANRATQRELVQRGLTREEYLKLDKEQADQVVQADRKGAINSLARKLDELYNPFQQLENKGVVPHGYFDQRAEEISSGHRRQESIIQELQQRLNDNPEYVEVVAEGIVEELGIKPGKDEPSIPEHNEEWQREGYDQQTTDESAEDSDEEQRRRLERLENLIAQRPEQKELVEKNLLYSTGMAPAIQNNAQQLQRVLQRRKSIDDVRAKGILHSDGDQAPAIQSVAGSLEKEMLRQQLNKSIKQRPEKKDLENQGMLAESAERHVKSQLQQQAKQQLQQKLTRGRRPTMTDLEKRGLVPEGYFSNAERAIASQRRRKKSVVEDLTARLQQRPDYPRMVAKGLLEKALERREAKQQLEFIAQELDNSPTHPLSESVKSSLAEKLDRERRPSYVDLQKKNILKKSFNPAVDAMANASAKAELERHNLEHNLKFQLAARRDPVDMVDSGYLYYPVNEQRALSPGLHGVAHELEENLEGRPPEDYLMRKGIIQKDVQDWPLDQNTVRDNLNRRLSMRPPKDQIAWRGLIPAEYAQHDALVAQHQQELIKKETMQFLNKKLDANNRPSSTELQQSGIVPNGAFDDVEQATRARQMRRNSLTKELGANISNRPTEGELVEMNVLPKNGLQVEQHNTTRPQRQYHEDDDEELNDESSQEPQLPKQMTPFVSPFARQSLHQKQDEHENNHVGGSPRGSKDSAQNAGQENSGTSRQPAPRFAYQTNPPKPREIPQPIHRDVHEPLLEVDVLVPEPELNDNTIKSSPLAFMNVLDSLKELSDAKVNIANQYVDHMKEKAKKLFEVKSLFQKIEKYGLDHLDVDFKSCGDVDQDLDNLKKEIVRLQTDLYQLDEEYRPVHAKLREINSVESNLEKYQDTYHASMAQLRRIQSRINQVLQEHQTQRDSAMTALQATELQQGVMKSKISDKIAETLVKIDHLHQQIAEAKEERIANQSYMTTITGLYTSYFAAAQEQQFEQDNKSQKELELEEELNMCNNFLTGLNEFLKGLKKLRKEQRNRIGHLEQVIDQLHNQRAAISEKIRVSENEAIEKLRSIRHEFIAPLQEQLLLPNKEQHKPIIQEDDENEVKTYGPALSLEDVMRKRVNRMNQVYRKLRDLESRAMTTGSREYLRGLTEIRELQVIMSNQYLKHFFTGFVSKANQAFHDIQLASIAILEQTATAEDRVILDLAGVKMLINVLERNKRTIRLEQDIEEMMRFIEAMPDREIVIMQVARHLALATPYKHFIIGKHRPQSMMPSLPENDNRDINNPFVILDLFIAKLLEEWIGSICNAFGKSTTTSVRAALEDDVIAQVRPSNAARLVVNCVWGLDGTL